MSSDGAPAAGETIGQRLKRLRLERGLSQRELAAPGVSYAYISRIEAGTRQPSVKALRRLATKLGVSAEYLETGSELQAADQRELRLADLELAVRLDEGDEVEQPLEVLVEQAVEAGDAPVAMRARVALAALAEQRADYRRAVELLEAALEGQPFSPVEQFDTYATLGNVYANSGRPHEAIDLFERCIAGVEQAGGDPALEARYATLLSYALSDAGDLARAEQVVRYALDRVRDTGDPYMRVRLYWSLARLAHAENRPAVALANARKAIALLEATEDTVGLARAHLLAASIMITRGDPDEASKHLDRAEVLVGPAAAVTDAVMLRVKRAQVATLRRDGHSAVQLAREAIELVGDELPKELGSACFALAGGLELQGDDTGASEAYARAVDVLESEHQWREATVACRAWARMLRQIGREAQALDVLDRAAELGLRVTPSPAHADR
jgi:transcriptional regulator with XRE-family HTH domain